MSRVGTAFAAFFRSLFDSETATRVRDALDNRQGLPSPENEPKAPRVEKKTPPEKKPLRSDALTLLSTLQREGRLVDFLMEPVEDFSDQQVGAAARQVHRGCREVIQRCFSPERLVEQSEGEAVEVPQGYDGGRYQLVGQVAGAPPFQGKLTHHGWQATQENLPQWRGEAKSATVIAPIEVELG